MASYNIDAALSGSASLTAAITRKMGVTASLSGVGTLLASIIWTSHPGALPPAPSANSAATLQQFIDSLGPSKAAPMNTPSPNSVTISVNPPRKPFTPR